MKRTNLYNLYRYTGNPDDITDYKKKQHKKSKPEGNPAQIFPDEATAPVAQVTLNEFVLHLK